MNKRQAEQGLATLSGSALAPDQAFLQDEDSQGQSPLENGESYVAGKILKPPGQGNSEPFLQAKENSPYV